MLQSFVFLEKIAQMLCLTLLPVSRGCFPQWDAMFTPGSGVRWCTGSFPLVWHHPDELSRWADRKEAPGREEEQGMVRYQIKPRMESKQLP